MKRREFAIKSVLGLLGFTIIPKISLFAKSGNLKIIKLGLPKEHIRHGQFNLEKFTSVPELDIELKQDIFYRNGINKCNNNLDPIITTIKYQGKVTSVFNSEMEYKNDDFEVINYSINGNQSKNYKLDKALVCNTKGVININGFNLPLNSATIVSATIEVTGSGKFMTISLQNK